MTIILSPAIVLAYFRWTVFRRDQWIEGWGFHLSNIITLNSYNTNNERLNNDYVVLSFSSRLVHLVCVADENIVYFLYKLMTKSATAMLNNAHCRVRKLQRKTGPVLSLQVPRASLRASQLIGLGVNQQKANKIAKVSTQNQPSAPNDSPADSRIKRSNSRRSRA